MKRLIQATLISTLLLGGGALAQEATPPPNVDRPADAAQVIKEDYVKISGDQRSLSINVQEADGGEIDISVGLDDSVPGKIAKRVIERLKEKGVIEGDSWVIEAENLEDLKALEGLEALDELERLEKLDKDITFTVKGDFDGKDEPMGWAILIPIIGILTVFGSPVLIVYLVVRAATRRRELMHENINRLLEQGKDIPPELLQAFQRQTSPEGDLYRGIRLSLIGVALIIALSMLIDFEVGSLGFIPLAIGLAQVITWKIQQNKKQGDNAA